jgi:hypothetical protein
MSPVVILRSSDLFLSSVIAEPVALRASKACETGLSHVKKGAPFMSGKKQP